MHFHRKPSWLGLLALVATLFTAACDQAAKPSDGTKAAPSDDAALASLDLGAVSLVPPFNPLTTTYTAEVTNVTGTVTVSATAHQATATIVGHAGVRPLSVGENTLTLVVTAQDGITKMTYTVTVTRAPAPVGTTAELTFRSAVTGPGLIGIDTDHPLRADLYQVDGVTLAATPAAILGLTSPTATATADLVPGTYYSIEYSDQDNSGNLSLGDWLGDVGSTTVVIGENSSIAVYPWPHNIGPRRALTDLGRIQNIVWFQYSWKGGPLPVGAPGTSHLTTVLTSNPGDVTDHSSWVVYPNGGDYSNQRSVIGLTTGATYGLFFFEDADLSGTLDGGETYYWSSGATFPSLAPAQRVTPTTISDLLANPQPVLVDYGSQSAVFVPAPTTGTIGTITVN